MGHRECVSNQRKNPLDVPSPHHSADQCNVAQIFPYGRTLFAFFACLSGKISGFKPMINRNYYRHVGGPKIPKNP